MPHWLLLYILPTRSLTIWFVRKHKMRKWKTNCISVPPRVDQRTKEGAQRAMRHILLSASHRVPYFVTKWYATIYSAMHELFRFNAFTLHSIVFFWFKCVIFICLHVSGWFLTSISYYVVTSTLFRKVFLSIT